MIGEIHLGSNLLHGKLVGKHGFDLGDDTLLDMCCWRLLSNTLHHAREILLADAELLGIERHTTLRVTVFVDKADKL